MAKDYGLHLHNRPLQGATAVTEITHTIEDWSRSTTFTGGPWQGTFKVFGARELLKQWFYEYLGYHVQEISFGDTTWEGFIWEIDFVDFDKLHWTRFTQRGRRRRRTYENMYNRILVAWNDPSPGASPTQGETIWYDDLASQGIYGIKEEVIYRDVQASLAAPISQEFLAMHAHPDPQLIALEEKVTEPFLEVSVVGYAAAAQFKFTDTIDDSSSSVGAWVEDILDTDLQFVNRSRRAANTRSVYQSLGERMRAWDLLENLLTMRGPSDEHYNITFEPGRVVNYDIWDPEPTGLYWNGALTTKNFDNMEERPRLVKPGIYRDTGEGLGYATKAVSGSFFLSPQDFLLETIEVDEKGELVPRLGVYEDEEALRTFSFEKPKKK